MLDLTYVREHLEIVEDKLRARGTDPAALLGGFRELDSRRRAAITESENLKAQRNRATGEIARLKKQGQPADEIIARTKVLREEGERLEREAGEYDAQLREIMARIPNLPCSDVPPGKTAEDNVEVRRWGQPLPFDFEPKPHWELGEQLGILDTERGAKLSGARLWQPAGYLHRFR